MTSYPGLGLLNWRGDEHSAIRVLRIDLAWEDATERLLQPGIPFCDTASVDGFLSTVKDTLAEDLGI